MSVKDDVELVRRGYEAFIAGDMVWLDEHFHKNVVWHVPGHSVLSGTHRGRDAVVAILGSEDHVVVLANITWRRQDNGETFSGRTATVFHLDAARVIEVWALDEDPEGFDEFVEGAG